MPPEVDDSSPVKKVKVNLNGLISLKEVYY